jgi:sulfur carrier protein ThiS
MEDINEIIHAGELTDHSFRVTDQMQVKDLLEKLNLQNKYFAIIVDGKAAKPEDLLQEGAEVYILPKIAGGM